MKLIEGFRKLFTRRRNKKYRDNKNTRIKLYETNFEQLKYKDIKIEPDDDASQVRDKLHNLGKYWPLEENNSVYDLLLFLEKLILTLEYYGKLLAHSEYVAFKRHFNYYIGKLLTSMLWLDVCGNNIISRKTLDFQTYFSSYIPSLISGLYRISNSEFSEEQEFEVMDRVKNITSLLLTYQRILLDPITDLELFLDGYQFNRFLYGLRLYESAIENFECYIGDIILKKDVIENNIKVKNINIDVIARARDIRSKIRGFKSINKFIVKHYKRRFPKYRNWISI